MDGRVELLEILCFELPEFIWLDLSLLSTGEKATTDGKSRLVAPENSWRDDVLIRDGTVLYVHDSTASEIEAINFAVNLYGESALDFCLLGCSAFLLKHARSIGLSSSEMFRERLNEDLQRRATDLFCEKHGLYDKPLKEAVRLYEIYHKCTRPSNNVLCHR